MIIDPLEPVLNYLMADSELAALVGDRIAAKHRYGKSGAWETGQPGLTVLLDGGAPDIYAPVQAVRLEVRAYATGQAQAMRIWRRLVEIGRRTSRVTAPTSQGRALVYWFYQASGPSMVFDSDTGMDTVIGFFNAAVGESAV